MSQSEQRESERLLVSIPIRVIGFDKVTGEFSEDTRTIVVSRAGARLALKHQVTPEDIIRIINLENYNEADFRVVGPTHGTGAELAEWGVECTEPGRNIWGIDLPSLLSAESRQAAALLECRACHKQGLWPLTLMEVEVLDSTGVIQRGCDQDKKPTYWTYADVSRRPRQFTASEPVAPEPREDEARKKAEKRATKRLGMKLPILIRTKEGTEETAKTENISKHGFGVSLVLDLALGEIVNVICPYTPASQNIEQRAEVRQRPLMAFGGMRVYGFRYIR